MQHRKRVLYGTVVWVMQGLNQLFPGPGVPLKATCSLHAGTCSNDPPMLGKKVIGRYFCHFLKIIPLCNESGNVQIIDWGVGCFLWPQDRGEPRAPLRPGLVPLSLLAPWKGQSHRFQGGIRCQLNQTHCSLSPQSSMGLWECFITELHSRNLQIATVCFVRVTLKLVDFCLSHYESRLLFNVLNAT